MIIHVDENVVIKDPMDELAYDLDHTKKLSEISGGFYFVSCPQPRALSKTLSEGIGDSEQEFRNRPRPRRELRTKISI